MFKTDFCHQRLFRWFWGKHGDLPAAGLVMDVSIQGSIWIPILTAAFPLPADTSSMKAELFACMSSILYSQLILTHVKAPKIPTKIVGIFRFLKINKTVKAAFYKIQENPLNRLLKDRLRCACRASAASAASARSRSVC